MKVQETKKQEVDKVQVEEIPKEYRTLLSPCNIPAGRG